MSDILCVTNRLLCRDSFIARLEQIAACRPAGILLREKDLPEPVYEHLAAQAMELCRRYQVPCVLHYFTGAALRLHAEAIHLPLPVLRTLTPEEKRHFRQIGASCHSVEEALKAQELGCNYVTAGHIFETSCKQGLPGRGLAFLSQVCRAVDIPVYAIGGITAARLPDIRRAGAAGACLMSSLMQSGDVRGLLTSMGELDDKTPS